LVSDGLTAGASFGCNCRSVGLPSKGSAARGGLGDPRRIYAAMAFSLAVEALNIRARGKRAIAGGR
jgi:hypothetical protein